MIVLENGFLLRVRHDVDVKAVAFDAVYREAGAIHRDRALGRDIVLQRRIDFEAIANRARVGLHFHQRTHAVDMTAHQVPAECVTQGQRRFEIHRATGREIAQAGFIHRFHRHVGAKRIRSEFYRRQAGAINRDAVAEPGARQVELATGDREPDVSTLFFTLFDATQRLNNSGKH